VIIMSTDGDIDEIFNKLRSDPRLRNIKNVISEVTNSQMTDRQSTDKPSQSQPQPQSQSQSLNTQHRRRGSSSSGRGRHRRRVEQKRHVQHQSQCDRVTVSKAQSRVSIFPTIRGVCLMLRRFGVQFVRPEVFRRAKFNASSSDQKDADANPLIGFAMQLCYMHVHDYTSIDPEQYCSTCSDAQKQTTPQTRLEHFWQQTQIAASEMDTSNAMQCDNAAPSGAILYILAAMLWRVGCRLTWVCNLYQSDQHASNPVYVSDRKLLLAVGWLLAQNWTQLMTLYENSLEHEWITHLLHVSDVCGVSSSQDDTPTSTMHLSNVRQAGNSELACTHETYDVSVADKDGKFKIEHRLHQLLQVHGRIAGAFRSLHAAQRTRARLLERVCNATVASTGTARALRGPVPRLSPAVLRVLSSPRIASHQVQQLTQWHSETTFCASSNKHLALFCTWVQSVAMEEWKTVPQLDDAPSCTDDISPAAGRLTECKVPATDPDINVSDDGTWDSDLDEVVWWLGNDWPTRSISVDGAKQVASAVAEAAASYEAEQNNGLSTMEMLQAEYGGALEHVDVYM
jgi:Tubulin epsilon and delta complex protein 1